MPKVVLMLPDVGGREYDFEVAPIMSSSIQLRVEGERHFYRVEDVWHAEAPSDGRVLYFASLAKEDAPERWATAEAYVLPVGDADVDLTPSVPAVEEQIST